MSDEARGSAIEELPVMPLREVVMFPRSIMPLFVGREASIKAIAKRAIERKTGARGLRNVMEKIMLDIMYRLPSLPNVRECVINRAVIEKGKEPVLLYGENGEPRAIEGARDAS